MWLLCQLVAQLERTASLTPHIFCTAGDMSRSVEATSPAAVDEKMVFNLRFGNFQDDSSSAAVQCTGIQFLAACLQQPGLQKALAALQHAERLPVCNKEGTGKQLTVHRHAM